MDTKKMANNILEFLYDPTVVPVVNRLYIGPEERLDNRVYEKAKEESSKAYRDQKHNSDMYPTRNRQLIKMGGLSMDRRTFIASLDILAQNFTNENDPIATDLRTMAHVISEMKDEEISARLAEMAKEDEKEEEILEAPAGVDKTANAWIDHMTKVRKDPANKGKSFKEIADIAKSTYKKAEVVIESSVDTWNKAASDAVARAIVADVTGIVAEDKPEDKKEEVKEPVKEAGKKKGPGIPDGTGPMSETPACPLKKEDAPVEAKKEEKMDEEVEAAKVVDTDILAASSFDGIELSDGMVAADIGDMSTEEKARLNLLFN